MDCYINTDTIMDKSMSIPVYNCHRLPHSSEVVVWASDNCEVQAAVVCDKALSVWEVI